MNALRVFGRRWLAGLVALSMACGAAAPLSSAELIGTDQVAAAMREGNALPRARISALLERPEVQAELIRRGVSVDEARKRVAALTDEEVDQLAGGGIESLPAGASDVLGAILVVFVVLLITDILGFTKVFSFTRPMK
ncbi:MAG TPA: PA2779 family protein [Burkholderiales bacterium]|nr:PA2779 family protein [Burkholderiales bacterium]